MNDYKRTRVAGPLLALLMFFISMAVEAGNEWKQRKNSGGITVYTRNVPGSESLEFMAVTDINATMECLLKLLEDVDSYTTIFPSVREAKIAGMITPREPVLYQLIDVPAPAKNRDTVIRVSYKKKPATGAVILTLSSHWDYLPERPKVVRVKVVSGSWELVPDRERGVVRVTYQLHNDPGGNLPPWVVNIAVVKRPFNVLRNLKKMVKIPKYRDARPEDLRFFR